MDQATHNKIVSFIWGIADDVLRDLFRRGKYPDVILPMCMIRRMDAVLEPTKPAAGQAFYHTSKFTLRDLKPRRCLAMMNVALRGIKADFGSDHADTFRRILIEADLVDCMVALPGQIFYSTQLPVCLWFLAKNKSTDTKRGFRACRKQTLFVDARKLGIIIDGAPFHFSNN